MAIGRAEYTITEIFDGDDFYRAWSNSSDGSLDFSDTDSNRIYLGTYTGLTPPTNYSQYKWTKIKGDNAIIGDLSNDSHQIGTDANGNNENYYGAESTLTIFRGGKDDTNNWTINIEVSPLNGVIGNLNENTFKVTNMSVDVANVIFRASPKTGNDTPITKVFSLSKNKQGIQGDAAVNYTLYINSTAIKKDRKNRIMIPDKLVLGGKSITGSTSEPVPYIGYFKIYEQSEVPLSRSNYEQAYQNDLVDPADIYEPTDSNYPFLETYRSTSSEIELEYNIDDLINTMSIRVYWYKDSNFSKLLDAQTVIISADGLSSIGGHLTNDNITFPADETGKILNTTGGSGNFIVFDGTQNVTASATFTKTKESNIALTLNTQTGAYSITSMLGGTDVTSGSATIRATYDGTEIEKDITVSKAISGENATSYWLTSDVSTITKHPDNTFDPKSITFKIASQRGDNVVKSYAGRFLIETSNDGTTYTTATGYPTTSNSSVNTFTVPSNIKFIRVTAFKAGGTTETIDVETIPILQEVKGEDAYTVLLSNESHTFAGAVNNALASTIDIDILGYVGATQSATTIGTITSTVTGINANIINNSNGTTSAKVRITVTTALTASNGVLSIPITVDEKTFTKTFSFAVSFTGKEGGKGDKGDNAQIIHVEPSSQIFSKNENGIYSPTSITIVGTSQNITISSWQYKLDNGNFTTTKPAWVARSGNTLTINASSMAARTLSVKALNGSISDTTTIAMVEDGISGIDGQHGRTVSLTSNSGLAFIYDSKTSTRSSQSIILTAQATNTKGTVYYQFLINGSNLQNNTSNKLNYDVPTNYSSMPVSVQVNIREGSGSGTILASDTLTLMGLKAGYSPIKGSDYYDGVSYTVMLSKETHNFVGVTGHAVAGEVTSKVIAHKSIGENVNQVSATIGTITGIPAKGATVNIENNGSQNAQIVIKVTEELTEDDNQLIIPITVDGVQFYKTFSFGYTQKVDGIEDVLLLDVDYQEGIEIYTPKADDSVVHVEMDGKSVGGGSGKNIYPYHESILFNWAGRPLDTSYFKEGVTYSYSYEIEIIDRKLSGSKADLDERLGRIVYSGIKGIDMRDWYISASVGDRFTQKGTFQGQSSSTLFYVYGARNNTTNTNQSMRVTKLMINEGGNLLPYELPAPTPDYPIEIHSLNDFDVVSSKGKGNILNNSNDFTVFKGYSGVQVTYTENITVAEWDVNNATRIETVRGTYDFQLLMEHSDNRWKRDAGKTYTYSVYVKNEGNSDLIIRQNGIYATQKFVKPNESTRVVQTGTIRDNPSYSFIQVHIFSRGDIKVTLYGQKIEEGGEVTPYSLSYNDLEDNVPYLTAHKINILLSESLRSVGDVEDRLFRDSDGLWKVERKLGEYTTDGTDAWSMGASSGGWNTSGSTSAFYSSTLLNKMKPARTKNAMTDRFTVLNSTSGIVGSDSELFSLGYASWGVIFRIKKFRLATDDSAGFKSWIANNPVTIVYELAESSIETLPQIDQNKLNNITSFLNSNYIYTIFPDITNNTLKENLHPNLKATFKSYAWYKEYKYQLRLETIDRDIAQIENLSNSLYNNIISAIADGILTSNEVSNIEQLLSSLHIEHEDLSGQYQSLLVGRHTDPELSNQLIDIFSEYNTFYDELIDLLSSVISSDSIYLRNTVTGLPKDRNDAVDYQYAIEEDPLYLQKAEEINEKFISYRSALRALTNMMTNMIYGYINKGIDDLEITDYVRNSDFDIVADSITANISQSGGHNYIRNSTGWNWSTDPLDGQGFWTMDSGSASNVRTDIGEIYNTIGTGSAFRVSHTSGTTAFYQQINLPPGIYSMDGYIMNIRGVATIRVYNGSINASNEVWSYRKEDESGKLSHMDPLQNKSFNITRGLVTIRIAISGTNAESFFSGLMFKSGEVPSIWTPHPAESYNSNVRTDINGIKVFHSSNLDDNEKPFTRITPLEFAGYDYVNGSLERVFTLNGDTTEVINLKVKNHIDIGPIRLEADNNRGLVIYKNN